MRTHFVDEWIKRNWWIRDANPRGDLDVIDEVVTRDMYGVRSLLAPGLVLDVGAHIGSFSVMAKTLWPQTPVIAFEPNPESHELLCMNTHEWTDVICANAGVRYGEQNDLVYVNSIRSTGSGFLAERDEANALMAWKDSADKVGYEITSLAMQTVTLEDYIILGNALPIPASGILLKLDAELAEVNILNGMSAELASRITRIVGEYHCEGGWGEFLEHTDRKKFQHLGFHCLENDLTKPIGLFKAA